MNFLKKLLNKYQKESGQQKQIKQYPVKLSLDDSFVHHFINKGGKFLYCTKIDEVMNNFNRIVDENNWTKVICNDIDLLKILQKNKTVETFEKLNNNHPTFITCEHLIANSGEILFSSNQLGGHKLPTLSDNFIVYATTSQLVKNISEALTAIKLNFKGNLPTNICSIKNYTITDANDDFLDYGNSNTKNMYLILFEDL